MLLAVPLPTRSELCHAGRMRRHRGFRESCQTTLATERVLWRPLLRLAGVPCKALCSDLISNDWAVERNVSCAEL
jgi:hypothetical protein